MSDNQFWWSYRICDIINSLNIFLSIRKREVELFNARDFQATTIVADYPELKDVIIDERDKYLTYNLQLFAGIDVDVNGELVNLLNSGNSKYWYFIYLLIFVIK